MVESEKTVWHGDGVPRGDSILALVRKSVPPEVCVCGHIYARGTCPLEHEGPS